MAPGMSRSPDDETSPALLKITISDICLFLILLSYLFVTVFYLSSSPALTYDEAWQWSTAESLAEGSGFATSVFGDFLQFDSFSFERMPLPGLLEAVSIRIFGSTVFAVRLPSVILGGLLLILVYLFAARWLGPGFGVVAAASLAWGQFCVVEPDLGVGIADVSRSARHDMALGFFSFLTIERLAAAELMGGAVRYVLAGVAMGLAFLVHPVALVLIVFFLAWWLIDDPLKVRLRLIVPIAAFLISVPYLFFLLRNWDTASSQLAYFNSAEVVGQELGRFSFSMGNLISNSSREWIRYEAVRRCIGVEWFATITIGLVVLGLVLFLFTCVRSFQARYLLTAFATITVCLASLEAIKYPNYLVMILPLSAISMSYTLFLARPRPILSFLVLALCLAIPVSSFSRLMDYWEVAEETADSVDALADYLGSTIPEGSSVVGSLRYWPVLEDRVFYDYQLPTARVRELSFLDSTESLADWFQRVSPDYIIVDRDWRRWAYEAESAVYADPAVRSEWVAVLESYHSLSQETVPGYGLLEILSRRNPTPGSGT